jgi:opacity protein-like surface antigen
MVVLLMLAMTGLGAHVQAQSTQGDSSFGFIAGGSFLTYHATLGVDYRYNLTDEIRLVPSITHFIKNNDLSAWAIDMNANYLFSMSESFGFYPLAGLDLSFWKSWGGDFANTTTRLGASIGLGAEYYATRDFSVGLEIKYLIAKYVGQPMIGVRIGYNFH